MKLTFNIDKLIQEHNINLSDRPLTTESITSFMLRIKHPDNLYDTDFQITSTDIKDFLNQTFFIEFEIGCRNSVRLASCIRQIAKTRTGVKTKINLVQFKNLIILDDFIEFIYDRFHEFMISKKGNEEQLLLMRKELTFMNYQKYKDEITPFQKNLYIESISNILGKNPKFSLYDNLKEYYMAFINTHEQTGNYDFFTTYKTQHIYEGIIPRDEEETLEIIASRYIDIKNNPEYKTKENLESIEKATLIKNFINDLINELNKQNDHLRNSKKISLGKEFFPPKKE
ncbi:hypothetical protein [Dolosigranulum pigrum]|uniref:hypothetical protein n=1 Tax=Dolosigranulum pigrum TaxID=29394 RepID=UPI000DC4B8B1|nr:hypothetical protein [Dolosigranulum pigrum]RAN54120.1 hypothetical protein B8A31_01560 [Dolosigranulum pigrum]